MARASNWFQYQNADSRTTRDEMIENLTAMGMPRADAERTADDLIKSGKAKVR